MRLIASNLCTALI